jgi:hypothetical protein
LLKIEQPLVTENFEGLAVQQTSKGTIIYLFPTTTTARFQQTLLLRFFLPTRIIDSTTVPVSLPSHGRNIGRTQSLSVPRRLFARFFHAGTIRFGVPKTDAEQAADVLAKSDLRGIDPWRGPAAYLF